MFTYDSGNDNPLTDTLNQIGYSSMSTIENMGSAFMFLVTNILGAPVLLLVLRFIALTRI